MRGLDARTTLAYARVLELSNYEAAIGKMDVAHSQAYDVGKEDFTAGYAEPPLLFDGECILQSGWKLGFDDAHVEQVMREAEEGGDASRSL